MNGNLSVKNVLGFFTRIVAKLPQKNFIRVLPAVSVRILFELFPKGIDRITLLPKAYQKPVIVVSNNA